jgi:hypothetical protein
MGFRNNLIACLLVTGSVPAYAQSITPGKAAGGAAAAAAVLLLSGTRDDSITSTTTGTGLPPGGPAGIKGASNIGGGNPGGFVFDLIVLSGIVTSISTATSTSSTN